MNITYANQISLTVSENEAFLRFATIHPQYSEGGDVLDKPAVSNEQIILLTRDAFEALKELINRKMEKPEEK